jgi:predicted RNA-binding protein with TRAM domain
VEIVEPHMYDVDDAVAKIDGYIISIAGAAPHVGEKRMVRIDQVGRTAASAQLLDESGEVLRPPARSTPAGDAERDGRRAPGSNREGGRAAGRVKTRARGRRAPADREDAEARREAGLSDSPTGIDSEPEEELARSAGVSADAPSGGGAGDGLQSKPRRRGRRGKRRRSPAKAPATPE